MQSFTDFLKVSKGTCSCQIWVHGWLEVELKVWQHVSAKTLANIHQASLFHIPEEQHSTLTSLFHDEAP